MLLTAHFIFRLLVLQLAYEAGSIQVPNGSTGKIERVLGVKLRGKARVKASNKKGASGQL